MIKLSIIIPFFNSEKYLKECLFSICNQVKKNVEVILINDNSKDKSLKISQKFQKKYKFIRVFNNIRNCGVSVSRNIGIKNAQGEYILFIDSDDKLIKKSLKNILFHLDKNKNTDLFSIKSKLINSYEIDKNQINKSSGKKKPITAINNFSKFRATCWNFIINRNFLIKQSINFKNIRVFEDQIFVTNILLKAKNLILIKDPIYERRLFEINSLGKKTGKVTIKSCIRLINEFYELYKENRSYKSFEKKFFISRINFIAEQLLDNTLASSDKYINKLSIKKTNFIKKIDKNNKFEKYLKKILSYKTLKIKELKDKLINRKKIVIFCASAYSEVIIKICKKLSINIDLILDNNENYNNQKLLNIKVKKPDLRIVKKIRKENKAIFICNKKINAFKKIEIQLKNMGIKKENIIHIKL